MMSESFNGASCRAHWRPMLLLRKNLKIHGLDDGCLFELERQISAETLAAKSRVGPADSISSRSSRPARTATEERSTRAKLKQAGPPG